VTASELPAGQAAVTVHRGSYAGLGAAHQAVLGWCAERDLALSGTRWEIYGPHHEDQTQAWTEVYWLLG
jgi:effector-binding domain-containing protein